MRNVASVLMSFFFLLLSVLLKNRNVACHLDNLIGELKLEMIYSYLNLHILLLNRNSHNSI